MTVLSASKALRRLSAAIEASKPDVLLAGSRGTQLVAGLIERKVWRGATLLLSAACSLQCLATLVDKTEVQAHGVRITFVHGTADSMKPIARVRLECAAFATARLVELSDGHSLGSLGPESLVELVREAHAPGGETAVDVEALATVRTRMLDEQKMRDMVDLMPSRGRSSSSIGGSSGGEWDE